MTSPGNGDDREQSLVVQGLDGPMRLDRVLRRAYPEAGRQAVQRMISAGRVSVNGRAVWLCSWQVRNGDRLQLAESLPHKQHAPAGFDDAWIIADDGELIAVNKPAGLLSQAPRWREVVNLQDLAGQRFGPVALFHRLDRDTSGVVLLTRGSAINRYLDRAFKARTVEKTYLAVVMAGGRLAAQGTITARVAPDPARRDQMVVVDRGGKAARTRYQVAAEQEGLQWVWLWPETGRTHQLRVHLAHLGAPILGDRLYHPHWQTVNRLMLHARQIVLPQDQGYPARSFVASWPEDFLALPGEGEV